MNDIYEKQNTDELLQIQFAAKVSYNKAALLNVWFWFISILLGFLWILSSKNELYENFRYISLIFLNLLSLYISHKIKYWNTLGASSKAYYDDLLFGFIQEEYSNKYAIQELKDAVYDIIEKNKKAYNFLSSKTGEDKERGVRNWYTSKICLSHTESVYSCQRENTFWDKKLSKTYASILLIIIVLLLLCVAIYFKLNTLKFFLNFLLSFASLLTLVVRDILNILHYIILSAKIEESEKNIDLCSFKEEKLIKNLQVLINKRRNLIYIIPDIIHKINTLKLHKKWRTLN